MDAIIQLNMDDIIRNIFRNNKTKFSYSFKSGNESDTILLGKVIGKYAKKGDVITLNGELGSGKTVLVKGIGEYYDIKNEISSPTFAIVNEYNTPNFPIYHFDVYRLTDSYNFESTVGCDYFEKGLCVIEWGKIIEDILPRHTINIDFCKNQNNTRLITIWRN